MKTIFDTEKHREKIDMRAGEILHHIETATPKQLPPVVKYDAEQLIKTFSEIKGVKAIILYGSRARGDYEMFSDWDLLIIVDGSSKDYLDHICELTFELMLEHNIIVSPIVKSENEIVGFPLWKEIINDGVILWKNRITTFTTQNTV